MWRNKTIWTKWQQEIDMSPLCIKDTGLEMIIVLSWKWPKFMVGTLNVNIWHHFLTIYHHIIHLFYIFNIWSLHLCILFHTSFMYRPQSCVAVHVRVRAPFCRRPLSVKSSPSLMAQKATCASPNIDLTNSSR